MKITLYMAMSINGMIATSDFSEDMFGDEVWDYSLKLYKNYDCIIWGRKTYEMVNEWKDKYLSPIKDFKKIIISSNSNIILKPNEQVFRDPQTACNSLQKSGYKNVLLSGGSKTNSEFAKLGLIDEVALIVDSTIIGDGVPLFSKENIYLKLKLISVTKIDDHLIFVKYKVIK